MPDYESLDVAYGTPAQPVVFSTSRRETLGRQYSKPGQSRPHATASKKPLPVSETGDTLHYLLRTQRLLYPKCKASAKTLTALSHFLFSFGTGLFVKHVPVFLYLKGKPNLNIEKLLHSLNLQLAVLLYGSNREIGCFGHSRYTERCIKRRLPSLPTNQFGRTTNSD